MSFRPLDLKTQIEKSSGAVGVIYCSFVSILISEGYIYIYTQFINSDAPLKVINQVWFCDPIEIHIMLCQLQIPRLGAPALAGICR